MGTPNSKTPSASNNNKNNKNNNKLINASSSDSPAVQVSISYPLFALYVGSLLICVVSYNLNLIWKKLARYMGFVLMVTI